MSTDEIHFRCSVCRGFMSFPRSTAGRLVECPSCRASMLVPEQSTRLAPEVQRRLWIGLGSGLACVLLVGLAVHLMRAHNVAPPTVAKVSTSLAKATAPTASLPRVAPGESSKAGKDDASLRELQTAHRILSQQYEELANWVLSNMRGHFLLKDRFVKNLNLPPLTDGFRLHPDMMDFLEVSPRERDLLDDALGYGLSTMATLETQFLSVTQASPEQVSVHIPPYEKEGAAMQDDLYRAMETVLGAERFDRLLDAGEQDLVKKYHYFGTASRTMTFQLTASEDPSEPPYLVIRDGWVVPDGPGKRSIQVAESSVRELPRDYQPYLSWLPDFVAAFARP